MRNEVFQHLSDEDVEKYMAQFMAGGMTKDEAFTETYAIDCNMDYDDDDE